jgi:hypothetical protein
MPKHKYEVQITLTLKGEIDPDEIEGFEGDSAESSDVQDLLEEMIDNAGSLPDLGDFNDADLTIDSREFKKIELVKEEATADEDE